MKDEGVLDEVSPTEQRAAALLLITSYSGVSRGTMLGS
jgi:hypothetical protein